MVNITCISDLHGYFPKLRGGDLLIIAGDCTSNDSELAWDDFYEWLNIQPFAKIIVVAGNHDNNICEDTIGAMFKCVYLKDDWTIFEGLKIYGSPWTAWFHGINPHCKAYTCSEEELAKKWALIPDDIDILVTHSPSFGNYDWVKNRDGTVGPSVGSLSLWMKCLEIRPKLHVFGHIHEAYGHCIHANGIILVNASIMNEYYEEVNKPVRIEL